MQLINVNFLLLNSPEVTKSMNYHFTFNPLRTRLSTVAVHVVRATWFLE